MVRRIQQPQEQRYPVLQVHAGRDCSCFRNPPNSDMEYRIFIVRTRSFLCVRVGFTRGGWAHRQRVSTTFLTRKNWFCFSCALDGVRTRVMECGVRHALPRSSLQSHSIVLGVCKFKYLNQTLRRRQNKNTQSLRLKVEIYLMFNAQTRVISMNGFKNKKCIKPRQNKLVLSWPNN